MSLRRVAIVCTHPGCGHGPGRHIAGGGCEDCECPGFTLAEPPKLTRCSECKRRPNQYGPGDLPIYAWGNHLAGCSRRGLAPDATEQALTGARP